MCLCSIDPDSKRDESAAGVGWKTVILRDAQTFSLPFFAVDGSCQLNMDRPKSKYHEWLEAHCVVNQHPHYLTGFHIFANEKDARLVSEEWRLSGSVVRKVCYRDVLATGKTFVRNSDIQSLDGYLPTIVAKFMCVEPPSE